MQRSLLAAAVVGGLCSLIGVFVVLRGLAFVGAGAAHAAFAGVALAYLMGWPPLLLAILFGLVTVWISGWVEEKGTMKLDVSIGILYTTTMALAILFIGLMKTYNAEVYGYLFGNVLSVTPEELRTIGGLSIVVVGSILLFSKELYFIAFDQEMAEASGVPARRMFFLLLTLVALTVVVSLKTVGAILVFAMVLIPASTAYQLTHFPLDCVLPKTIAAATRCELILVQLHLDRLVDKMSSHLRPSEWQGENSVDFAALSRDKRVMCRNSI
jgi:ABC-type Mn2+/Zn2+ transport system permease subunit